MWRSSSEGNQVHRKYTPNDQLTGILVLLFIVWKHQHFVRNYLCKTTVFKFSCKVIIICYRNKVDVKIKLIWDKLGHH